MSLSGSEYPVSRLTNVLILAAAVFFPVNSYTLHTARYFAAGVLSWHLREGNTDFGNDRSERVALKTLRSQGLSIGGKFGLPFGTRLIVPFDFEAGKAREREFVIEVEGIPTRVYLNSVLYSTGAQPMVQFPFRLSPGIRADVAIGGGLHYVVLVEEERLVEDRWKWVLDDWLEKSKGIHFSIAGGGGFEVPVNSTMSVFLRYTFRYWQPVRRMTGRDLFPLEKKPYVERFLSHSISAGITIVRP